MCLLSTRCFEDTKKSLDPELREGRVWHGDVRDNTEPSFHGITEWFRLEKLIKIIESDH